MEALAGIRGPCAGASAPSAPRGPAVSLLHAVALVSQRASSGLCCHYEQARKWAACLKKACFPSAVFRWLSVLCVVPKGSTFGRACDTACLWSPPAGRRSPPGLHADGRGPAGVQPAGQPQRSDVVRVPALPRACQPGLELELSSSKLYPLTTE